VACGVLQAELKGSCVCDVSVVWLESGLPIATPADGPDDAEVRL
jgi:hypothetical protein